MPVLAVWRTPEDVTCLELQNVTSLYPGEADTFGDDQRLAEGMLMPRGSSTRLKVHDRTAHGCHKVLQRESRTFRCAVVLALTCSLKRLVLSLQLLTVLPNLALKQADISGEGREGPFAFSAFVFWRKVETGIADAAAETEQRDKANSR